MACRHAAQPARLELRNIAAALEPHGITLEKLPGAPPAMVARAAGQEPVGLQVSAIMRARDAGLEAAVAYVRCTLAGKQGGSLWRG